MDPLMDVMMTEPNKPSSSGRGQCQMCCHDISSYGMSSLFMGLVASPHMAHRYWELSQVKMEFLHVLVEFSL